MINWKVIGIIFIILFILENTVVFYMVSKSIQLINKENDCAYRVCQDYNRYEYDNVKNICYCFDEPESKKKEILK